MAIAAIEEISICNRIAPHLIYLAPAKIALIVSWSVRILFCMSKILLTELLSLSFITMIEILNVDKVSNILEFDSAIQ